MVVLGSPRMKKGQFSDDLLTHMQKTELDQSIEEQDSVPELPEIPQLQHLAKNRPKRPKKHASTKNVLKLAEGGDSEDIKEGLDTFFAKSLTPNQTPIGSPLFEELHGSRHGSISSASSPSIASRSREDLRTKVSTSGKVSPLMFDNHGRRSPAETQIPNEMTSSKYKHLFKPEESKKEEPQIPLRDEPTRQPPPQEVKEVKSRGGLSCLKPATLDDDLEPLTKSPERKPMMSPSGRSISDIFGKVAQDKLKSKTNDRTPPGTSPFTARRSETEVFTSKRRSFFTGEPTIQIEEKSPDDGEGGSDDVVKRSKTGLGLGGDILAEMRVKQEKRASVIPKTSEIGSLDSRAENKEEENPFGGIKLRKTARR